MTQVRAHKDLAGAVIVALAVVSLYSAWGAHMLAHVDTPAAVATSQ